MLQHSLPHSIENIRDASKKKRERILKEYLEAPERTTEEGSSPPSVPSYLKADGLIESHLARTKLELALTYPTPAERAYTRTMAASYRFDLDTEKGTLSEVSIAALSGPLQVGADLHVAASFFSTMVAAADDYLDAEGAFDIYGQTLFYVTHAYRDMVDLALEAELKAGTLNEEELLEIRSRLALVLTTLTSSETTTGADEYLYRKSCGDSVVSVLFPASKADNYTRKICAEIGRKTGEAGQLIDDVLDYQYDLQNSKKNYIVMSDISVEDALDGAYERIEGASKCAARLDHSEPVSWVLGALTEVVELLRERHASGQECTPETVTLSRHVGALIDTALPANQFLAWF
ncbi:MAG: hypothetical protein IME99_04770 [Proteobacteria bacterium]|nr:hypothetical protein [Pseudomonadota bacterium]